MLIHTDTKKPARKYRAQPNFMFFITSKMSHLLQHSAASDSTLATYSAPASRRMGLAPFPLTGNMPSDEGDRCKGTPCQHSEACEAVL